jgi:hypothetical protein
VLSLPGRQASGIQADARGDFVVTLSQLHQDVGQHALNASCGNQLPTAQFFVAAQAGTRATPGLAIALLIVLILLFSLVAVGFRTFR